MVLVAGPPGAGCSAVLVRLRERLPAAEVVEATDLVAGEAPCAVVFVVSAVAPVTASDAALAHRLTRHTAAVVAVVAKVDDHRRWAAVLETDRAALPGRFAWVAAAAAPRLGAPRVDELVDRVAETLADPALPARNRLQAWRCHLADELAREEARNAHVDALHQRRRELLRDQRDGRAGRVIARREAVSRTRLQLAGAARARCSTLRTELSARAAEVGRAGVDDLVRRVPDECAAALAEIDDLITAGVAALPGPAPAPAPVHPPELPAPLLRSRRLETQLMTVLGAGFGLGVTLALARLLSGLAPGQTAAALLAGLLAGAAVTVWVVRARGLLHDRMVLLRWAEQAGHALRSAADERVAARMLAAEVAVASATAAEDAATAARLADVDAELHAHRRRAEAADSTREGLRRRLSEASRELSESFL
ncbi:hypothetical protein CRI77_00415 [Mycolicibacterium duvalii]|nr:hypothetical protein CRI77_00415 [Mycolicibacterium duvalii]